MDVEESEDVLIALSRAPSDSLQISTKTLLEIVSKWKEVWLPFPGDIDPRDTVIMAAQRFNGIDLEIDESLEQLASQCKMESHHIETAYKKTLFVWVQLLYQFKSRNLLETSCEVEGIDFQQTFKRVAESMLSSRWILHSHVRFMKTMNPNLDAGAPANLDPFQYMPFDPNSKFNAYQELTLFVLQKLKQYGYRRFRSLCWKTIMTPETFLIDQKEQHVSTLAWEPVKDPETQQSLNLKEFIQSVVKKEDHLKQWQNMMQGNNLNSIAEYLDTCNEEEFAPLKPDRHLISFRNGVLDCAKCKFYEYTSPDLPREKISCNYIHLQFNTSWPKFEDMYVGENRKVWAQKARKDVAGKLFPWEKVFFLLDEFSEDAANERREENPGHFGTPKFLSIFDAQLGYRKTLYWKEWLHEMKEDYVANAEMKTATNMDGDFENKQVQNFWYKRARAELFIWHYALLGRLLFKVGEKDNWQIIQFFKGAAATGKSTLLDLVKCFYREEDVEIMSNEVRKGDGGLETVWNKFLWQCAEVKGDFALSQSQFQSMVSGEMTSVSRLFKTNLSVIWEAPGILAGNEFASWKDNSGSILRRVVVTNFAEMIDEDRKDPMLKKKMIAEELHKILYKCLLCYLFLTDLYDRQDVWKSMPKYFTWTKKKLSASTDPLGYFLNTNPGSILLRKSTSVIGLDELLKLFLKWGEKEQLPKSKLQTAKALDMEKLRPLFSHNKLKLELVDKKNIDQCKASLQASKSKIPNIQDEQGNIKREFWIVRGVMKNPDAVEDEE